MIDKNNFAEEIENISNEDFKKLMFLLKYKEYENRRNELINLLRNNITAFANRINTCDPISTYSISNILQTCPKEYVEKIFKGQLSSFYKELKNPAFNFFDIFNKESERNRFSDEFCNERDNLYMSLIESKTVKPRNISPIVRHLLEKGKKDFIQNNAIAIAEKTRKPLRMLSELSGAGVDITDYAQFIDEKRVNDAIHEMISDKLAINFDASRDSIDIATLVVKELMQKENTTVSQIKPVGEGGYSIAFKIGSKIVKIGREPETYHLTKNSKRFLQPLLRKNLPVTDRTLFEDFDMNLTVTELCGIRRDITENQVYQVYKDLRDEGIVWTDCKASNLGVLLKDNIVHYSTKTRRPDEASINNGFYVHPSNAGFHDNREIEALKAGELVIVDLDFLYDEKDYNNGDYIVPSGSNKFYKFEERYQREKSTKRQIDFETDKDYLR